MEDDNDDPDAEIDEIIKGKLFLGNVEASV